MNLHSQLTANELAQLSDELHDRIELIVESHQALTHQAKTMGRGYPSGGLGAIGTSDTSSVERNALDLSDRPGATTNTIPDPATEASKIIGKIKELRRLSHEIECSIRKQLGATNTERENTVPQCLICEGPAVPCRRGLCNACRMAHHRAGYPDIEQFKRERRAKLRPAG